MPRRSKGPRLWLRPARRNAAGVVTHPARYFILDNGVQSSTGFGVDEAAEAQQVLASCIAGKYEIKISTEKRDPSVIPIRDVLALYLRDVVSAHVKAIAPASMLDAIALVTSETRWHAAGSRYVVQWSDHSVGRVDKTVAIIAADAGLGHVTPHVLRHTAATWQMQAGTDLWEASKYLGMTVRTLEQTYGHHRPQHLTQARDAYRRMDRQRFANEKDEREANITPQDIAENHQISAT